MLKIIMNFALSRPSQRKLIKHIFLILLPNRLSITVYKVTMVQYSLMDKPAVVKLTQ